MDTRTQFEPKNPDPLTMDSARKRAATTIAKAWVAKKRGWNFKIRSMRKWSPKGSPSYSGEYRFVRTVTSNGSGSQLLLKSDASGYTQFFVGANNGNNIQLDFSLQQMRVLIGGVMQITSVVPNYAEFASLFDQWCIEKVEVHILPSYNGAAMSSNGLYYLPTIIHAVDDDDSAAATNLDLMQYGNARYTQLLNVSQGQMKPIRVFRPKPAIAAYQTGATFAYGELTRGPKWIDVSYPTVPHYSFKAALDPNAIAGTANATTAVLDVVCRMHYKFKTVR